MTDFKDVINVGISDENVAVFEGQYKVKGMAYNSYLIKDEKVAVLDTVDLRYGEQWIKNIRATGLKPDYLFVTHVEPDHSSNIALFTREFPDAEIVASAKAFSMIKNFYGESATGKKTEIKDGDSFFIGKRELLFIAAPMVHWPEVTMIYDKTDKILFSADAFGRFGTGGNPDDRINEMRRYYTGIVCKYGAQVQAVLKKIAAFSVTAICPLHGEIITENLGDYIGLYDAWSAYRAEKKSTAIFYASVYGNTAKAAIYLADEIEKASGSRPPVFDLATCDMHEAVAAAFAFSNSVFAATTYNADVFPYMRDFITRLTERNFKNRKIGFIENGSWAPNAVKVMTSLFEKCENLSFCETKVRILSSMNEQNLTEIKNLAKELAE